MTSTCNLFPVPAIRPYLVSMGAAMLDISGVAHGMTPLHPKDIVRGSIHSQHGGVARNTAENLARLGCACYLISVFGDDRAGQALMAGTRQAGVDLSPSFVLPNAATATCLIVHGADGEVFVMMGDPSITERMTTDGLVARRPLLQNAALITLDSVLGEETLAWLFDQPALPPFFVDTVDAAVFHRIRPWLGRVHTLKTNRREASLLSGLPFDSRMDAPAVAVWFLRQGVRQVVLSLGAHGLYYSDGRHADWLDPLPVEVVNVTGAGDALMAGLAYGWLHGMPFPDTVAFANACAALTLTTQENNDATLSVDKAEALLGRHSKNDHP